jgi:hypothetical protein
MFTSEQLEYFNQLQPWNYKPSGDQTPQQACNTAVTSWGMACQLEFGSSPTDAEILIEMDKHN